MTDDEHELSTVPRSSRSRLPSPGCLLTVTALAGVAVFVFGIAWRAHRQQERLQFLEQLHAEVVTEPAAPVWLHDLAESRLGAGSAVGFTEIKAIHLNGTQVTDADLRQLSDLTRLQTLRLDGNPRLTDAGLSHLNGLTGLEDLALDGTGITDAGLAELSHAVHLRFLSLEYSQVSDAGLQHLSPFPELEILWLDNTQVTRAGIRSFQAEHPRCRVVSSPTAASSTTGAEPSAGD